MASNRHQNVHCMVGVKKEIPARTFINIINLKVQYIDGLAQNCHNPSGANELELLQSYAKRIGVATVLR